ncbi:hypothetical protein K488DRAFT_52244 [Vararia minispora EC-137]|uniref:Uncharacterized protein n=1 Tax=Vararia minispora EC-137 TaxID=1314806 RepID=A0ACB8QHR1_9AGAM|nr:hypothetical protein K488DRAFT_52244 [Vararia minispora EC-137]
MAKGGGFSFFRDQLSKVPPVDKASLTGKTILVVGANVGLGLDASKHFASMKPARLILACRSQEKGEAAMKTIEEATGFRGVELRLVDLSRFASVVEFAAKLEDEGLVLDIYVYNAGVLAVKHEESTDGWELSLQVNALSVLLLSVLLLPSLLRAASAKPNSCPRMIIVGSEALFLAKMPKDILNSPNIMRKLNEPESFETASMQQPRYCQSKALTLLITRELAARLAKTPIIAVNPHPGYCYSELRRNFGIMDRILDGLLERLIARSTEEGSRELVWAAIGMQGREDELRGAYTNLRKVAEPSDFVISEAGQDTQKRIWGECVEVLSEVSPAFKAIVNEHLSTGA